MFVKRKRKNNLDFQVLFLRSSLGSRMRFYIQVTSLQLKYFDSPGCPGKIIFINYKIYTMQASLENKSRRNKKGHRMVHENRAVAGIVYHNILHFCLISMLQLVRSKFLMVLRDRIISYLHHCCGYLNEQFELFAQNFHCKLYSTESSIFLCKPFCYKQQQSCQGNRVLSRPPSPHHCCIIGPVPLCVSWVFNISEPPCLG